MCIINSRSIKNKTDFQRGKASTKKSDVIGTFNLN